MESNGQKLASPEEVLQYIEEHNNKANLMIDEGYEIIQKIKKMNEEISSEIQKQNAIIKNLDKNVDKGKELTKKGLSKIDEAIKHTSTFSLVVTMIVQILFIIFLVIV